MINVLSYLRDNGFIQNDAVTAKNGDLIAATGCLTLIDPSIIKMALDIAKNNAYNPDEKPPYRSKNSPEWNKQQQQLKEAKQSQDMFQSVFSNMTFPAGFALSVEDARVLCGTLHESKLQEPINTYYFKHGNRGLSDIHIIGIKEETDTELGFPFLENSTNFLDLSGNLFKAFEALLFPADGIRVLPLVIFRSLIVPVPETL